MDLDELQVRALRPQLLGEPAAHVGVHRLDERGLAHPARAPQQCVVCRQTLGEAFGVVAELARDRVEALQERERHPVDLAYRLERLAWGIPNERLGSLEVGLLRARRGKPLERGGKALQAFEQRVFFVHHFPRGGSAKLV